MCPQDSFDPDEGQPRNQLIKELVELRSQLAEEKRRRQGLEQEVSRLNLRMTAPAITQGLMSHRAQAELKKSEERFRRFFESGILGVFFWNMDGAVTDANDKFLEMIGYDRNDLTSGRVSWVKMNPPEYRDLSYTDLNELKATGFNRHPYEKEYIRKDGSRVPIIIAAAMLDDERFDGVAFALDITARKQIEEQLRSSEKQIRRIIETANEGVWIIDHDSRTTYVNTKMASMLGYTVEEMFGRSLFDFADTDAAEIARQNLERRHAGIAEQHDFRFKRKDGTNLWALVSTNPIMDDRNRYLGALAMVTDITERKLWEEALREGEEEKRIALDAARMGTWRHDLTTDMIRIDGRAQLCYGINSGMITFSELLERIHPDDAERLGQEIRSVLEPRKGRTRYYTEYRIIDTDGGVRWLSMHVRVLFSGSGNQRKPVYGYGTVQDITKRKQEEETIRRLNETLEQRVAERTELAEARSRQLQSLAVELIEAEERERRRIADLLHEDLQQLLASARFMVQSAVQNKTSHELEEVLHLLEECIGKSRRLSHELSPTVLHHSSLTAAIEWLTQHMHEQFGLAVHLDKANARKVRSVPLKAFLFRAVKELLFNVVKHSGVSSASVQLYGSEQDIIVTVSDDGKGFEPSILEPSAKATGLGLLSLRERARYIGGSLTIESEPGRGSLLTLKVPLSVEGSTDLHQFADVADEGHRVPTAEAFAMQENIRVIFADDHKVMRQGLIRLISRQPDIEVVGEAANGREALELTRQLRPDVVVMDVSMPEMDGIEATRRIKAEFPGVHVIALSMYEDEHISGTMYAAGAEAFVCKSASSGELLKIIYAAAHARNSISQGSGFPSRP